MTAKHGRKTMNANDVIEAIEEMEFPQFTEPLKKSLQCKDYEDGFMVNYRFKTPFNL